MEMHKDRKSKIKKLFGEFCEMTSVHGVRHVGDRRRHWFERFWWAIAISVSIFFCLKWLDKTWYKRTSTPVITTIANEATQIVDIAFPAITMCSNQINDSFYLDPHTILKLSEVENYRNISIDVHAIQKHSAVANFCNILEPYLDDYKKYINFTFDPNILKYLQEMTPDLLDGFNICSLDDATVRSCQAFFKQIVTDVGLCYTFNHLNSCDIYNIDMLSNDFPKQSDYLTKYSTNFSLFFDPYKNLYRMKNSGIGLKMQLRIPIVETSFSGQCNVNNFDGFRMQIHSSDDVAYVKKHFIHIPYDHDVLIRVYPRIMSTTQNVIDNYRPQQRKCIDQHENHLKFFKVYTQGNCRLEEFAMQMVQKCKCVVFWMPRLNGTNVCHLHSDFTCVQYISRHYTSYSSNNCLPACNSISYETSVTSSKLIKRTPSDNHRYATISIVFKDQQYFASVRSELYGTMDFIAQCE